MFKHDKALLREVKVERPNPQYAVLMQEQDRKSTRLNSSHITRSRMPSSA